jgi:hypothetical protein
MRISSTKKTLLWQKLGTCCHKRETLGKKNVTFMLVLNVDVLDVIL